MRPDRGSIHVDGREVTTLDRRGLGEMRKRVGMVFQGSALFDSMTIGENVALGPKEHNRIKGAALEELVQEKLGLVGLDGVAPLMPSQISGGMKKRAALARAIAMDPDIMLYDEPTAGLDPVMAEQINDLIRDLQVKLKTTSIAVTHDLHSACYIGDRVALLEEGEIGFVGTNDELRTTTNEAVRRFMARGHVGGHVKLCE
jgi:phospholipid/cholesterol/gamma-HCH transport system ATP-binding protein